MSGSLTLADVTVALGDRRLFAPLSFSIAPGEITTVMGPSGSGKSTLLSYLSGFLAAPFTGFGRVSIGEQDITGQRLVVSVVPGQCVDLSHRVVANERSPDIPPAPRQPVHGGQGRQDTEFELGQRSAGLVEQLGVGDRQFAVIRTLGSDNGGEAIVQIFGSRSIRHFPRAGGNAQGTQIRAVTRFVGAEDERHVACCSRFEMVWP